jgi:glutathione S-transferase
MPAIIQLCVFEKKHDEPSSSGFCQKLETFFRACDYSDYESKFTTGLKAPKGKLPYIIIDDKPIADSHFIIQYLIKEQKIKDLDAGLTPVQRAESRAWQAYIEELVFPAAVWTRVAYPENLPIVREELFSNLPVIIKQLVQWLIPRKLKSGLVAHGVGRHSREEVDSILEDFTKNLDARLKGSSGPFFHGATPTIIDCVIYGFLTSGLGMRSNPSYSRFILESEELSRYVARCTRLWFPEYTHILEMVDSEETTGN